MRVNLYTLYTERQAPADGERKQYTHTIVRFAETIVELMCALREIEKKSETNLIIHTVANSAPIIDEPLH